MLLFWFAKAFFLVANHDQASQLSARELAGIYGHGLKMDVATACYVLLLPCVLIVVRFLLSARLVNRFVRIYTLVIAGVASLLLVLDAGLYPHWGTRVNVTVFNYIDDSVAVRASVSLFAVVAGLLIAGSITAGFYQPLMRRLNPRVTRGSSSRGDILTTANPRYLAGSMVWPRASIA